VGLDHPTLHRDLPDLAAGYEHVVIDGPPRVTDLTRSAILAADVVLIPVQPGKNVDHIREQGLEPEDIEHAYATADEFTTSRSSGRPAFYGLARNRSDVFVVYEEIDATTWYVVTAYRV